MLLSGQQLIQITFRQPLCCLLTYYPLSKHASGRISIAEQPTKLPRAMLSAREHQKSRERISPGACIGIVHAAMPNWHTATQIITVGTCAEGARATHRQPIRLRVVPNVRISDGEDKKQ